MSLVILCDNCGKPATYTLIAIPIPSPSEGEVEDGADTCDDCYEFTHPGKNGGVWWDDYAAPQSAGIRQRPARKP